MRSLACLSLCLVVLSLGACTHVKGIAVEDASDRPLKTAQFSVGRPDGVGTFGTFSVNGKGEFDFYISSLDVGELYVYDGNGAPQLTMRHLDRGEINEKMRIPVHPAPSNVPDMEAPH